MGKSQLIVKAIFAGMVIMFGCMLNTTIGGIMGAIAFSLGLVLIVQYKWNLFTGKVGLITLNQITWSDLLLIFLFNVVGVAFARVIMFNLSDQIQTTSVAIISQRLTNGPFVNFLRAVGCGILVTCGVARPTSVPAGQLVTIMCVAAFIVLGFPHCIADIGYMFLSNRITLEVLLKCILPTIAGNVLGGVLLAPFILKE